MYGVSGGLARASFVVVGFVLVLGLVPSINATSSTYLTTGITQSGMKQASISGYNGVLVNYTNTYPSSFGAFVYLDLTNAAGQTVYWYLTYFPFAAGQMGQPFVQISASVPAGNYTAWVFVATTSGIPVSTLSSVKVTL
jgi:hypothetical protein